MSLFCVCLPPILDVRHNITGSHGLIQPLQVFIEERSEPSEGRPFHAWKASGWYFIKQIHLRAGVMASQIRSVVVEGIPFTRAVNT